MLSPIHLICESSAFPPVRGEDDETNPGIFGRAFTEWLADRLRSESYEVKRLVAEDFGRLIEVTHPGCKLYAAVSSTDDSATEWRVFAFSEFGLLAKLKGSPGSADAVTKLMATLKSILTQHPEIR